MRKTFTIQKTKKAKYIQAELLTPDMIIDRLNKHPRCCPSCGEISLMYDNEKIPAYFDGEKKVKSQSIPSSAHDACRACHFIGYYPFRTWEDLKATLKKLN